MNDQHTNQFSIETTALHDFFRVVAISKNPVRLAQAVQLGAVGVPAPVTQADLAKLIARLAHG